MSVIVLNPKQMLLSCIEIGPVGIFTSFEPETPALQGQCSTTELRALFIIGERNFYENCMERVIKIIGGDPTAGSPTVTL